MSDKFLNAIVRCCRDWTIVYGFPWGRCGVCRTKPEFVDVVRPEMPEFERDSEWPTDTS